MMKTLSEKEWKDCQVDSFATVNSGRDIYAQERIEGNTPYITSGTTNNGIGYFVENDNNSKSKNAISVNRNGAVGEAFYHPYTALYGNDCRRVNLIEADGEAAQLFVARCISNQKAAFSYSRKLGTGRLKKLHVMLPINDSGEPDYDYMSEYVKEHKEAMLAKYRDYAEKQIAELGDYVEIPALDEKEWGVISIPKYFEINKPEQINKPELIYISAKKDNNGFKEFTNEPKSQFSKGSLTWNKIGDGGAGLAYYHDYCYAMDTINVMSVKPKIHINKYLGNFIARGLSQYFGVFNHGHTLSKKRFEKTKVMLPITDDGEPDFKYMEQYAKNMMLRKYKQYLAFLENQEVAN